MEHRALACRRLDGDIGAKRRRAARLLASTIVCRAGEPANHVYVLLSGRLTARDPAEDKPGLLFRSLDAPGIFGDAEMIAGQSYQ